MDGDEDMGTGMTLRSGTMTGAHAVPQPQQEASAVPVLTTPEQKYDCFVRAIGAALGSWDALQVCRACPTPGTSAAVPTQPARTLAVGYVGRSPRFCRPLPG